MKNRAVIYARLSREDENKIDGNKESRSIENQISALTNFCNEQGFDLVEIYYDDGYSGANLDRPDIQRLLKDMKMHKFDIVVVKDISRLGRSLHRVGELIDTIFPANNIRLISVNDKYDSQTYKEDDSIVLRNFLNDYYLKEFKKKIRKSRDFRVQHKHITSFPKFGYLFDEDKNEIIDKNASEIVKLIFDLVGNKKYNLVKTAQILNEKNIKTRSDYQYSVLRMKKNNKHIAFAWDRHSVNDIVSDYEYCGHSINLVNHKYKKNDRILIKNTHLAIIDEELFKKAQEVISINRKVGRNGKYNHIATILKDKKTGFNYTYNPPRIDRKSNACYTFRGISGSINANLLHDVLYQDAINVIKMCSENKEKLYYIFRKKYFNVYDCNIVTLKSQLDKTNEKYSILLEKHFNNYISDFDFQSKSYEYLNKIKEIEEKISSVNKTNEKIKLFEIRFKRFLENIKILPCEKLDLIRLVIKTVVVNKIISPHNFDITIHYKFE